MKEGLFFNLLSALNVHISSEDKLDIKRECLNQENYIEYAKALELLTIEPVDDTSSLSPSSVYGHSL